MLILGSLACGVIAMADGDILYGTDGSTLNDLQLNGSREKKEGTQMEALLGLTCCAATAAEPAAGAVGSQCACECIGAPQ